jgi:hypothetical protein
MRKRMFNIEDFGSKKCAIGPENALPRKSIP